MAYNKTTWKTGDVITADKLNNIEDGISTETASLTTLKTDVEDLNINKQDKQLFDKSKFTVVGSPTITDDGIVNNGGKSLPIVQQTVTTNIQQHYLTLIS